jgi:glutamate-ammonia-ligase adenylyltransferase
MPAGPLSGWIPLLREGEPGRAVDHLARLGAPEPERSAGSLRLALARPELCASAERWLPGLLLSPHPGFGAQALADVAAGYARIRGTPLDAGAAPLLPRLLGSSGFLARILLRRPDWADELRGDPPPAPRAAPLERAWRGIRAAKYRGLLRVAARDLAGRPFEQSLRELSDLADRVLETGLELSAEETGSEPPALLALGKLGGRELNFSSDVDLLFLYEDPSPDRALERRDQVARLIGHLKRHLELRTEDGFAYRVDLDLRPEGRPGLLANPVEPALRYYETFGAEWERQMLIRLRAVAGPPRVARAFGEAIAHFVYRSHIDPQTIRQVRAMKARIEEERRAAGRDLELELKEGPGGIRDVEFLVQALQLFHGAREPRLRTGNTLEALAALGELELLPAGAALGLRASYLWLRRAEHALQLAEERQTHRFPREGAAQLALARRMGYAEPEGAAARSALLDDWTRVRSQVREHFDALVLEAADD